MTGQPRILINEIFPHLDLLLPKGWFPPSTHFPQRINTLLNILKFSLHFQPLYCQGQGHGQLLLLHSALPILSFFSFHELVS